jgi:two-component system LytT family sensor kinase
LIPVRIQPHPMHLPQKYPLWSLKPARVVGTILVLWLTFAALDTVGGVLISHLNFYQVFSRQLAVAGIGAILTFVMFAILRMLPHWSIGARLGIVALLAALAGVALGFGYFMVHFIWWPVAQPQQEMIAIGVRRLVSEVVWQNIVAWYFMFASGGALYLAMNYAAEVREVERRGTQLREQTRIAELRTLRQQINPHFLFNVLNSLSTLISRNDRSEAEKMISEMARFLRQNLASHPRDEVTLIEEIEIQHRYLNLEQWRFPNRLCVKIDLAPGTHHALVPAMILQPIVENAVRHGVEWALSLVTVAIASRVMHDTVLEIIVEDDAIPPTSRAPQGVGGFGTSLGNVRTRLAVQYEGAAEFLAAPRPGGGFRAVMRFPLRVSGQWVAFEH